LIPAATQSDGASAWFGLSQLLSGGRLLKTHLEKNDEQSREKNH
jgi:hypothetical protein